MSTVNNFFPIERVEEKGDFIEVWGVLSSENIDSHGTIIRAAAIRNALPEFLRFGGSGALRNQHDQYAPIGSVTHIEVGDDRVTRVGAKVIDSEAITKVKNGVYKGFSLGGFVLRQTDNVIEELSLKEISLVDRPSLPDAAIALYRIEEGITKTTEIEPKEDALVRAEFEKSNALQEKMLSALDDIKKSFQIFEEMAGSLKRLEAMPSSAPPVRTEKESESGFIEITDFSKNEILSNALDSLI